MIQSATSMNRSSLIPALMLLWCGHFFVDFMLTIWPIFKTMAHINLSVAGIMAGVSALAGESMQLYFGSLSDKGHAKKVLIFGLVLACMNIFLPYTNSMPLIFLCLFCTFLGSGAFHPAAVTMLNSLSATRKGTMISIFASGGGLGQTLSPLLFGLTMTYAASYTGLLAIPMLAAAILFVFFRQPKIKQLARPRMKFSWRLFKDFFSVPEMRLCYFFQLANQTIFWTVVFLLSDILYQRGYPDQIAFGGGHLFLFLGSVCFMIPSGWLADKWGHKAVLLTGTITGTAALYALLAFPGLSAMQVLPLLFLFGSCLGCTQPLAVSLANIFWPNNPGIISAFLMGMVWCVAESIGPALGGILATRFGDQGAASAMALIASISLLAITCLLRLPEEKAVVSEEFEVAIQ